MEARGGGGRETGEERGKRDGARGGGCGNGLWNIVRERDLKWWSGKI